MIETTQSRLLVDGDAYLALSDWFKGKSIQHSQVSMTQNDDDTVEVVIWFADKEDMIRMDEDNLHLYAPAPESV